MEINSRLELTEIFCDVDDFYQTFERYWQKQLSLQQLQEKSYLVHV